MANRCHCGRPNLSLGQPQHVEPDTTVIFGTEGALQFVRHRLMIMSSQTLSSKMLTERRNGHWPSILRTCWWCDLFKFSNLFCTFVPRAVICLREVMKKTDLSERKIGGVADVAYAEHGDCPLEIPCVVHPALCIAPEKLGLCKRGVAFLEPRWRIPRSSGGGTSG